MEDFSDIINLPHHVSKTRRQMPAAARAAQFCAFDALTGFGDALDESARLTAPREAMSEDALAALDAAFQRLLEAETEQPTVTLVYFQPDAQKDGGAYVTYTGQFRHCDPAEGILHFTDGAQIPMQNICMIVQDTAEPAP